MGALVKYDPATASRVDASDTGLTLADDLSFDEWQDVGNKLRSAQRACMWWIGDWLLFGQERKWGDKYTAAVEATGYANHTLRLSKCIAGKFQLLRRRNKLSWSHHRDVSALESKVADKLLSQAESNEWTRSELRERVRELNEKRDHPRPKNTESDDDSSVEDVVDPHNYFVAYMIRADMSIRYAVYSGPITEETIEAARNVALAWTKLAKQMEKSK